MKKRLTEEQLAGLFGIGSVVLRPCRRSGKPFISETGCRSFLGVNNPSQSGMTTDAFARTLLERHRNSALKYRLIPIEPDVVDEFYAINNARDWLMGETLRRAVEALQHELVSRPENSV